MFLPKTNSLRQVDAAFEASQFGMKLGTQPGSNRRFRPKGSNTYLDPHLLFYDTILYHTTLYHTILYYTILYYTILYYTILYYTILYYTILYYSIVPLLGLLWILVKICCMEPPKATNRGSGKTMSTRPKPYQKIPRNRSPHYVRTWTRWANVVI